MLNRDLNGYTVRSADGEKLGKIVACDAHHLVIEKGFFFPKEYEVRAEHVADIRGDEVWLRLHKSDLTEGRGMIVADTTHAKATSGSGAGGEYRLPLAEEELGAKKTVEEVGKVRIHKDVVVEEKTITVPVAHEEIRVERVPAEHSETPGHHAFREGDIEVPVYAERVEPTKHSIIKDEVRISKERVEQQQRLKDTVKKEVARVDRDQDATKPGTPAPGTGNRRR